AVCHGRIVDPAEPDLGNCSGKAGDLGRALARDINMSKTFTLQDVAHGGDDILVGVLGEDATEAFHEVGHSEAAGDKLESLLVGKLKDEPRMQDSKVKSVGVASF
ncbi:cytochrome b5, partial [Colletotrichum kahawae]